MANRWPSRAGERVGKVTILSPAGHAGRYLIWRCVCDCGREEDIPASRLTQDTACSACRTRICRYCGIKLDDGRPPQSRTCSLECRRALNAVLAQESRARRALDDTNFTADRAAYNRARIAQSPEARAGKRASDRRHYKRAKLDPIRIAAERERRALYYASRKNDPAYRERHRQRSANRRAEAEREAMLRDLASLESPDE